MIETLWRKVISREKWRLARWQKTVGQIVELCKDLELLSDDQLRTRSAQLKFEIQSRKPLDQLLPTAFALVREAAFRAYGIRHFPVQLLGGVAMFHGCVAEMETGEGKTLTATLPLYLRALQGRGVHLATANDYLAQRDADWVRPIFNLLGASVGVVQSDNSPPERQQAYACDVTYGTAAEFGFDFLRDRLVSRAQHEGTINQLPAILRSNDDTADRLLLQRPPHFALIDEADSVLIDDARTPLVIGVRSQREKLSHGEFPWYQWAAKSIGRFQLDDHFHYDADDKTVELTPNGRELARKLLKPTTGNRMAVTRFYNFLERAIRAERDFVRDRDYVVRDGEVVIVDESTGRLAEGRKWQDGIHTAIEAKEGLMHAAGNGPGVHEGKAAQITLPELFSHYRHIAGMTGTAQSSSAEFLHLYKMPVVRIPTNKPCLRVGYPEQIFADAPSKWQAIVAEIRELNALGRPVLVGTRSINRSEALAFLLEQEGIAHRVLHAHFLEQEAEIVAEAGQRGCVTVATNMAGRGTDISLGEGVAELGGLHVICSELHDSSRIDRQLIGRCARQGKPGSYRQYLALDDDILADAFGVVRAAKILSDGAVNETRLAQFGKNFRRAQKDMERKHFLQRKMLMRFADERNKRLKQVGHDPYLDGVG